MAVTVRFAPSPTGRLHAGNIRTAAFNWLFARREGGEFVLRLDDTDAGRSREEYADGIRSDLLWLGLDWDSTFRQSDRLAHYDRAAADLKARGLLYPCYESADELERKRRRQRARGLPPVYDRAALELDDAKRAAMEREGRRPHWRFRLPVDHGAGAGGVSSDGASSPPSVAWTDLIRGSQEVDLASLSDPVLIREDGTYLYTLPSVVDDINAAVTHVIRGEDHATNTAVQIAIFRALGAEEPAFGHHSLLVGADGKALSKRLGDLSVQGMRETGFEPLAVVSHTARIGTSDPVAPARDMNELVAGFSFDKIGRAPARFDPEELRAVNARYLHELDFCQVEDRLCSLGPAADEKFWLTVRDNLTWFADAENWYRVIAGEISPVLDDPAYCGIAADLLPEAPWSEETWAQWTATVRAETGRKGRALFHPLRLALTGEEKGPELARLLPLIGRERALQRLRGGAAPA